MTDTNKSPLPRLAWMPALFSSLIFAGCAAEEPMSDIEAGNFRALENGLELYWTFEDSVGSQITDLSGNGRHGTLQAEAVLVSSPNGQAVSLDGVNDYVSLAGPRSPALYGGADGSFTLSARVKVANVDKYNTLCFGCGPFSTMYTGTEAYGGVVMSAFDDQSSSGKKWALSDPLLAADTWTQVTLVVENGAVARHYLDCTLAGQLDSADIGLEDPGFSAVGLSGNANRWFAGEIDELRVWSRVLNDQELALLCPVVPPLEQDLELHWTFEDRSGDQITDLSGNGRHGTNLGGAFVASPNGESLSLDGINDKVSFVGPRALSLYGGDQGDFTLSARVKLADVNKYNTLCFGCGPFKTMYVGDTGPGGRVLSNLYNLDTQTNLWTASSSVMSNDQWAEITLVVEGGIAARTYHDCTLDATLDGVNVGLVDPGYSAIGESSNASRWYAGEIDELRVWSRALPDSELALLCERALCDGPIYVDVDAASGGDGTSWATAFDTVQGAIDAAAACTYPQLWLAEGQYAPDPAQQVATITYPIEIYGGFSGVETALAQRDIAAHEVRLGADGWQSRVVQLDQVPLTDLESVRIDGLRISGSAAGAIEWVGWQAQPTGTLYLDNLTITDNSISDFGAALESRAGYTGHVEISNSSFERNDASWGGALWTQTPVTITNSSFVDNNADQGGAILLYENPSCVASLDVSATDFTGNTASWGGAIMVDDDPASAEYASLTIVGGTFTSNSATSAGAIYLEESTCSIDSSVFTGNTAVGQGGAVRLANGDGNTAYDSVDITNCRFIANQSTTNNGGALALPEIGATVINTEFTANQAALRGGAVFGRGDFVSSTFANNIAGTAGSGLFAYDGADISLRHCVAYPDTIIGPNIYVPYSCLTQNNQLLGSPQIQLVNTDPFDPADLDVDGMTEFYLLPNDPCPGLDNGVIDEFDWTSLTVDSSQCTDSGWPEPGVHYQPQSAVGTCQ